MAKRRRSGDPAKRRQWQELVKRWQQSGQTVRAFCRSAEGKESAFCWWRQRLAPRRVKRGEDRQAQTAVPQSNQSDRRTAPAAPVRHEAARFLPVHFFVMDQASQPSSGVENLVELPPETGEQLDWRPLTLFVVVHVRKKYARQAPLEPHWP